MFDVIRRVGRAKRAHHLTAHSVKMVGTSLRCLCPPYEFYLLPGSEITRLATSRFQMNSTTSAPMVAVMKPAPWSGL